jgi:hypothetical protein
MLVVDVAIDVVIDVAIDIVIDFVVIDGVIEGFIVSTVCFYFCVQFMFLFLYSKQCKNERKQMPVQILKKGKNKLFLFWFVSATRVALSSQSDTP